MIKVRVINRNRKVGNYSIEGVFKHIMNGLSNNVLFEVYNVSESTHPLFSIFKIKSHKGEINHITGDVHYLGLGLPAKTTIITVHDIGHYERTLEGINKILYKWFWLEWPLLKAKYITCVSEFTKNRLIESIRIPDFKIHVIYNPCPPEFAFSPKKLNTINPIILQVGKGENKNREGLIHAVKGMSCKLVFIGELNVEHQKLLNDFKIDYDNPSNISDEDMYSYYQNADIIYFASYYEGFGLPIIEGQAVGRPVITSNCASMPEIASDAALFVNPRSFLEIRSAIKTLIEDETFTNTLIQKGLQNVKRFELKKITDQYYHLYSIVAANT